MTLVMPQQLTLDLGYRTALGAEDFLVGRSNELAVALIDRWPDWPAPSALVIGPRQSGKTHLAHVWQLRAHAQIIAAADLDESCIVPLSAAEALVVEDIDRGIGCERTLFHLLNLAREHRRSLLLTSAVAPAELAIALPDLRSRLRALVLAEIASPDDGLLQAVLVKHFSDRQIAVDPKVVAFLLKRIERTMAAAATAVAAIDQLALATGRKASPALAGEALAGLAAAERA